MEQLETPVNKTKSFYGTFALIYVVLNIFAFLIMLLTTKWSILNGGDKGEIIAAGSIFMVFGIVVALICGIGPALVLHKGLKKGWMYAFPVALLLIGVSGAMLWKFTNLSVFSYAVLVCTLPAAPIYNCLVFNHSPFFDYMATALVGIAPLLYALVIYFTFLISRKRALRTVLS